MRLIFTLIAFLVGLTGFTQDSTLYKWNVSSKKIDASTYQLTFTTEGAKGWQLYAPDQLISDVPAAELVLSDSSIAVTQLASTNAITTQIPLLENAKFAVHESKTTFTAVIKFKGTVPAQLRGSLNYTYGKGDEFYSLVPYSFSVAMEGGVAAQSRIKLPGIDLKHPLVSIGGTGAEGPKSLWRIFLLGVLGGLLGLIMPCTFPMIPSTIGFFTKASGNRKKAIFNAFMYGFFIFLIYVLLSVPFYFIGGGNSNILNNISTNPWLNIFFAIIFLVFALSFFGLFEIGLSGNLSTKVDSKANVKTLSGIFFMALTLAIVSFSCTGPILGSLLVGALNEDGGAFQLTVAMAGFGLALGLPFGLFALFPRWLSSLPRSGNWMTTVKIVFAFVELALMVKFLSNADLVMQWGLIKREIFFAAWILIGIVTTLYLFGVVRFGHEQKPVKLGAGRIIFGVLFGAFTLYLIPGLTNTKYANRPLISGFPPPLSYSIYGHEDAKGKGVEADVVNDYEKALQLAKQTNKPLLIDFTGWACVNCRNMEENVWTKKEVRDLIEQNFVLVSLYVDDRQVLPADQQQVFVSDDGSEKTIRTIGDKYATLQSVNFKNASQPLYAIITPDERLVNLPVGYTPNVSEYAEWLRSAINAFKNTEASR